MSISLDFICQEFHINFGGIYIDQGLIKDFKLFWYYGINELKSRKLHEKNLIQFIIKQFSDKFEPKYLKFINVPKGCNNLFSHSNIILLPLLYGKSLFGIIVLWNYFSNKKLNTINLKLLSHLSLILSQAYSNLELKKHLIKQESIKKELKIARLIQQKIIPKRFITPKGVDIYGISLSANEIGGDFYDCIYINKHQFALVIADVSGKGIPASLFMALSRNTIRAEATYNHNPKKLINRVNKLLYEDSESGMFVTAVYLLFDTFNQVISYVSAGHNTQLLYNSKEKKVDFIKGNGKPLGIFKSTFFEEKIIFYNKGDVILLYTDGIIEAENLKGEQFGEKKIIYILEKNYYLPVDKLIHILKNEVTSFKEKQTFNDDFSILALRL